MTAPPITPAELAAITRKLTTRLASPRHHPGEEPGKAQSLATGSAGIALLHIEHARADTGSWRTAHAWIKHATAGDISAADTTGLFLGAPAIAFALHAAAGSSARYRDALATLDKHVHHLAHRRTQAAQERIRQGQLPDFHEYDIFFGLTGIGAHLLRRDPGGSALERVLTYLVALTQPRRSDDQFLPGWWVSHDPHRNPTPGGHANLGAAHGITGPLMLLSTATRRGITVDGQHDAITTILTWLDTWTQHDDGGPWWPETISRTDLHTGQSSQRAPTRPSWCYGTPGITRALQLAALATGDTHRQQAAEQALATCLSDPTQLARLTDPSLCHGWAGVYQTTWRAVQDAITPTLHPLLPNLAAALAHHTDHNVGNGTGFLDGDAGTALALTTAACNAAPTSGWDACLLID
ncbi:lanthionine synthetase C family protein [Streptomyces sp. NPDC127098]|uniref:lanthionine synthetase C family protein n=1 Tax=Streptomyces sp. NPDC127098 TaxID=3347137 RepID=UPI003667031D